VWDVVEEEYQKPLAMISKDRKMEFTWNAKVINSLVDGLTNSELVKVMECASSKAIWDKMSNFYEGDNKVKKAKLCNLGL